MRKVFFVLSVITVLFSSCLSRKQMAYFQDGNDEYPPKPVQTDIAVQKFEPVIGPKDILSIFVASLSPEASSFLTLWL
ncbi:MAG: hypothetical protein IPJ79_12380 [Bacteroidetes bacterium]|nr:hypothetical protein [Bacteroidota bacterium]